MTTTYDHPRSEMLNYLPASARTVLDVGCSSGAFGRELRRYRELDRLVGVEPTEAAATVARSTYDEVVTGRFPDVADQLPAERYDVVFFNDVLEHMVNPEDALASARKLLAPGGVVVASIPNVRHVSVLGPLLVHGEFRYRASGILDATHVRFFTRRTMLRLFAEQGWTVQRIEPINQVLRVGRVETPTWIRALIALTAGRAEGFFAVQYVVVAEDPAS